MKITAEQILSAVDDTKVICWSDLLIKLNLLPEFDRYKKEHGTQYSIQQVFLGKSFINKLDVLFKERIKCSKDKRIKYLRDKYKMAAYSMDCLQSMPTEAEEDIDYLLLKDL